MATKMTLAKRMNGVSESATLRLNALVQQMKASGEDIVNLTAGEPDFPVPEAAKAAVGRAVAENKSKYTPVPGILELRKAIAHKTNLQHVELAKKMPWDAANVVVSNGGKQAIFQTLLATLDPGDEVLIPSPYWLSYPEMVKICEGRPITLLCPFESGFKLSPEQLDRAISDRTRALILNSPSNPTGVKYTFEEFRALGDVLRKHPKGGEILVISDEIYDRIVYTEGRQFVSFLSANPDLVQQTVTVNGLSKSAAMTGWRVGWTVAPKWITDGILTLQGQSTSGINALAQYAGLAAMQLPEEHFAPQVDSFQRRRDLALECLAKAAKLKVVKPEGAFYIFVGVEAYYRANEESVAFAERLLKEAKVAVVPGTPFGAPGYLRLSFATDEISLKEGCERIVKYLNAHVA